MGKRSTAVLLRLTAAVLLWALALQFAPLTPAARQAVQLVRADAAAPALRSAQPCNSPHCHVLPQLPLWALLSFGFYAAGSIGWSIITFPTCPEAATELQRVRKHRPASRTGLALPLSRDARTREGRESRCASRTPLCAKRHGAAEHCARS